MDITADPSARLIAPAELELLADPVREYLINATARQARTVAKLAEGLGCAPTRLYRHVQLLLEAGLLRVEREVKVRGVIERHYRAAAEQFPLDRSRFARRSGNAGIEAIRRYVFEQGARDLETAYARGRIDPTHGLDHPQAVLALRQVARLSPAELAALRRRILALYRYVERLAQRRRSSGAPIALTLAALPWDPVGQRAQRVARGIARGSTP